MLRTVTVTLVACDACDAGKWKTQKAPLIGQDYWQLGPDGTMRDLILASEYVCIYVCVCVCVCDL